MGNHSTTTTPATSETSLHPAPTDNAKRPNFFYRLVDPKIDRLSANPERLFTSALLSPKGLLCWRAFALVWGCMILGFQANGRPAWSFFAFFTNLTWLGLTLYFLVTTIQTCRYVKSGSAEFWLKQSKFTKWATWNVYVLPATFHWIVPIIFWPLLSSNLVKNGTALSWWSNINVHALDLVFMLIELVLGLTPMYLSQWPTPIFFAALYCGFAFFQNKVYSTFPTVENDKAT
ncbi:hypothetical protein HK104_003986 [Borealophlyctis nickersoniae]|nr:hypothetical protein HK104_003986 [Borealophlyctis nickersoniae]